MAEKGQGSINPQGETYAATSILHTTQGEQSNIILCGPAVERSTLLRSRERISPRPMEKRSRGCRSGRRTKEQQKKKSKRLRLGGIFNLTDTILTNKETNILNLGLKCGLNRPINKFNVFIDIHKYTRRLSMKKYFLNKYPNSVNRVPTPATDSGLRNKSLFNPLVAANQPLDVFKGLLLCDLELINPKKDLNPRHIRDGIELLEKRKEIVIRPADKVEE